MNCDPESLVAAAACYESLAGNRLTAAMIYLACQWANNLGPSIEFSWTPDTVVIDWVDSDGLHTGDLAAFRATGSAGNTTILTMDNRAITAIDHPEVLPLLTIMHCEQNNLTSLDFTGCPVIEEIYCAGNALSPLIVAGCDTIKYLDCSNNNFGPTIDLTGVSSLAELYAGFNNLTSLNLSPSLNVRVVFCDSNANLTALNIGNSPLYVTLSSTACDLDVTSVDGALSNLASNCLANLGTCDLSGGTNAAPTNDCNPGSDCDALTTAGWTVTTN